MVVFQAMLKEWEYLSRTLFQPTNIFPTAESFFPEVIPLWWTWVHSFANKHHQWNLFMIITAGYITDVIVLFVSPLCFSNVFHSDMFWFLSVSFIYCVYVYRYMHVSVCVEVKKITWESWFSSFYRVDPRVGT